MILFCILFLLVWIAPCKGSNKTEIIVGSFYPSTGDGWPTGIQCYPSMVIAFDEINNNSTILPNYHITWLLNDSACDARVAMESMYWQETHYPLTAIIGGGCTVESIPLALLAAYFHQPQISYASTSPELSNKELYPYFMRVVPSDIGQAQAWVAILQHYGWKRIATLSSQESLHALLTSDFLQGVAALTNVTVITSESFPGSQNADITPQLLSIKNKGATITFVACFDGDAVTIMKLANILGMTEDYAWIGSDAWVHPGLLAFINISLVQGVIGTGPSAGTGEATERFYEKYQQMTGLSSTEADPYIVYSYDAAYALAYGLHQVLEIENFPYNPTSPSLEFGDQLHSAILNCSFQGISGGIVQFDSNGDRICPYDIRAFEESSLIVVAKWDPITKIYNEFSPVIWADGTTNPPKDQLIQTIFQLNPILKNIALVLTIILLMTTLLFLLAVFYWREHPRIKAATWKFLVIILVAALLEYCTVIIIYIEPVNDFTCIAPHWFAHLGFFIMFGCLFTKTFRVWQIYIKAKKFQAEKLVNLSDAKLGLFVCVFVLVGIIILVIFTVLYRPIPVVINDDTIVTLQYIKCDINDYTVLIALFLIEFLSLFFGVFLSYKTRKIELLKYNESSQIALCIYSIIFIGFIFIPIGYFLQDKLDPNISFLIASTGIIGGTTTVLGFIFIPKFRAIIKHKPDNQRRKLTRGVSVQPAIERVPH